MTVDQSRFYRVRAPRAHEEVAEQIRRQIVLRVVPPTRALPSERELARLFGVGRATVQAAIGLLQKEGLVERRRGRTGGTFVVDVPGGVDPPGRVLRAVRSSRHEIEEALDFRLRLEPVAAELAAGARDAHDLEAMRAASEGAAGARDDAEFMQLDTGFHLAVAAATHNRFFHDGVERIRLALNDALTLLPDSPAWHAWSNRDHELIRRGIVASDAAAARRAMRRHVQHTDAAIRALLATL
jgi:GntR family transcriptional repressor for pyruvate dehydrogenase complex